MTLQDVNTSSPIDVTASKEIDSSTSTVVSNITTTAANDIILGQVLGDNSPTWITGGSGQSDITAAARGGTGEWLSTYKTAAAAGVATLSGTYNVNTTAAQLELLAVKFSNGAGTTTNSTYTYAGSGYANPDAVTQIANGFSTTTFTYDNNGNVTQKTIDGTTTTYVYDYANRLIALGAQGATTTYGYDAFGQRVFQVGTSTTTLYPFKWYSVASSTGTGAKYATTTEYVFNGLACAGRRLTRLHDRSADRQWCSDRHRPTNEKSRDRKNSNRKIHNFKNRKNEQSPNRVCPRRRVLDPKELFGSGTRMSCQVRV